MKTSLPTPDSYQELREALRALCGAFDSSYWQRIDLARGYPEEFVTALTEAGWLAALIPQEYGLPRPDVQHGHAAAARLRRTEAPLPRASAFAASTHRPVRSRRCCRRPPTAAAI